MSSPLEIEIGLHYFCRADDYRGGDFSAPAVRDIISCMLEHGLLQREPGPDRNQRKYKGTAGLEVWVRDGLCEVPWPTMRWGFPDKEPPHARP